MGNFRKLHVWLMSKDLAVSIYKLTRSNTELRKDFRLKQQICSSAVSIASNIAEGEMLSSYKQRNRHFYIAKGSAAELITQLMIANEIEYITKDKSEKLIDRCDHIAATLQKLINIHS